MQLRLRTKLTLVMTSLVLLVAAVLSGVSFWQLLEHVLRETNKRTVELAGDSFEWVQRALADASSHGWRPESNSAEDIHDYVRYALQSSEGLQAQLKSAIGSPAIYEVTIIDRDGIVLVSSDKSEEGKFHLGRSPISDLMQRGFLHKVTVLRGKPRIYEYSSPFKAGGQPFDIRVAISTGLLLAEISPSLQTSGIFALAALAISTLLAAVVSRATLEPLQDISAQLDRISAGQYDAPSPEVTGFAGSGDELGLVSRKITQVGQQLRGVHEIFSTMRENMNSVMAGLEDGLLLFTRDARAVMISPAAEKFLGEPAGQFLGRRVTEIFPPGHPLHEALHIESDELSEVAAETELETSEGPKRVSVSVQAIQEDGERMGALVTLRDLDSLESINTQLQKSNIQLAQLLPIDVPEVYVDRALLKQAVLNLVLNAAEAMPNGGQLRLVLSRRGEMAEISVGDTGKGIPLENRQKIFQLFFTTRPGGSGIGLASTFRIVQLLNGSIDFTSEVGRGTTFRIELPLAA